MLHLFNAILLLLLTIAASKGLWLFVHVLFRRLAHAVGPLTKLCEPACCFRFFNEVYNVCTSFFVSLFIGSSRASFKLLFFYDLTLFSGVQRRLVPCDRKLSWDIFLASALLLVTMQNWSSVSFCTSAICIRYVQIVINSNVYMRQLLNTHTKHCLVSMYYWNTFLVQGCILRCWCRQVPVSRWVTLECSHSFWRHGTWRFSSMRLCSLHKMHWGQYIRGQIYISGGVDERCMEWHRNFLPR